MLGLTGRFVSKGNRGLKLNAESLLAMIEEIGPMEIEREQPMEQQERDFE